MSTACGTGIAQYGAAVVAVGGHRLVGVTVTEANGFPQRPTQVSRQLDHVVTTAFHLYTRHSHTRATTPAAAATAGDIFITTVKRRP